MFHRQTKKLHFRGNVFMFLAAAHGIGGVYPRITFDRIKPVVHFREFWWLKLAVALHRCRGDWWPLHRPPNSAAEDKLICYKCICKFPMKWEMSSFFPIYSLKDALFSSYWFFMCPTKSLSLSLNSCCDTDDYKDSSLRYSCFAFYQPSGDKWFRGSKVFIAIQIKRNHSASELPWSVLLGGCQGMGIKTALNAIQAEHTKKERKKKKQSLWNVKISWRWNRFALLVPCRASVLWNYKAFATANPDQLVNAVVSSVDISSHCMWSHTYWWHLRDTGPVWSLQELWLVIIDVLNLDYELRFGL